VVDGSPMATTLLLVAVVIVTAMVLDSTNGFMTVTARFGPAPAPPAMATATAAPAIAPSVPPVTAPCWVLGPVPTQPDRSAADARVEMMRMCLFMVEGVGSGFGKAG